MLCSILVEILSVIKKELHVQCLVFVTYHCKQISELVHVEPCVSYLMSG